MGYRRHRLFANEVVARSHQSAWNVFNKRCFGPKARSGVFLLWSAVIAACGRTTDVDSRNATAELVVGLAEGNAEGADLGVGQFANLLSFESLTNNDTANGRVTPRLAERWQWEEDHSRLRIFLRPNVFLHDGRAFSGTTALQIVEKTVRSPINLAKYPSLRDIARIASDTDLELIVDLSRPSTMLPEDLTVPLDAGPDAVGTGPYRVVERGTEYVLERFDKYYLGRPAIERIVVRPFEQLRTTWASLLRGEVDMVYDVPAEAVEFIRNDDVQVVRAARWYQFAIAYNSSRPPFRSPLVRRALNIAVNRTSLVEDVLQGRGKPSTGPVWPSYWAYDSSVGAYDYDPSVAAALLDEAGFPLPATGGSPTAPPARLRFTCLIPENFSVWERIALEVQKDLFDIGVDMQFKVVPFDEFNALVGAGRFDATLLDLISGPSPGRAYIFWRSARASKGLYNVFGYESPEAEQLFDALRTSTNDAAVRSVTRRLQRVMLEDPPALFIAWNERTRALRQEYVIPDQPGVDLVWTLWQWSRGPRQVASTQ